MRKFVFGSAVGCVSLIALMSCTTPEAPVAPMKPVAQVVQVTPVPPVVAPPAPTPVAAPAVHPGEAISKAIDRDAIVARVMGGVAVSAGELFRADR